MVLTVETEPQFFSQDNPGSYLKGGLRDFSGWWMVDGF